MYKIANVCGLSKDDNYLNTFYEYSSLLKYLHFHSNYINDEIPTLIVGYEYAKSIYPNIEIENYKINNKTYWCFNPKEFLNYFINGFKEFLNVIPDLLIVDNKFKIIDPFFTPEFDNIDKVIDFFNQETVKNIYYYNNTVYIYTDLIYIIDIRNYQIFEDIKLEFLTYLNNNFNCLIDKKGEVRDFFISLFPNMDRFILEKNIPFFINLKK